jgi:uncharacterized protein (TIGR03663 family)
MNKKAFAGLFLLVFLVSLGFRLARLDLRPMHHDEANQALKFGALLEEGKYRYDRADHHGPSLYYLSLPFAWATGAKTLSELSEKTLRLVTACFGLGSVLLLLPFIPLLGRWDVLASALCLGLSPAMVYFSRFFIQETLLVFFLLGLIAALWRYRLRPSLGWALAAGFFAGMAYATKETAIIAFAAIALALAGERLLGLRRVHRSDQDSANCHCEAKPKQSRGVASGTLRFLAGAATALLVSFLLFSSFFQNPKGLWDSILAFKIYFVRAGEIGFHNQPWIYYFRLLGFSGGRQAGIFSEIFILGLAVVGAAAALRRRKADGEGPRFLLFMVFYAVLSAAAYSLIPYKTPWNLLPFYVGFIVLAGHGTAVLGRASRRLAWRLLVSALLALGFIHLGAAAYSANFTLPADPKNPYVYAQTLPDFLKLVRRVEDLAAVHAEGRLMLIKVAASPYETWPLPWYLRDFGRVGYWQDAAEVRALAETLVLITDAEQGLKLEQDLKDRYQTEFYGLRPNVFLLLHIRLDLWERFLKTRPEK